MKLPVGTFHHCPNCNTVSEVTYRDQHYRWVSDDTLWKCPYCKSYLSNKEIEDLKKK